MTRLVFVLDVFADAARLLANDVALREAVLLVAHANLHEEPR